MTERPPEAPMHRRPMDPDEPDWPPEPVEPAPAPPPAIGTLPPGAAPLRIAVPAFWTLEPKYDQAWRDLKEAQAPRLVADVTVIPDSWAQLASTPPSEDPWGQQWRDTLARPHLDGLAGTVLGYVSTRVTPEGPLRSDKEIWENERRGIKAWYDHFGGQIDGIYYDELVLPMYPDSASKATSLAAKLKEERPGAKVMILAGGAKDEAVVGPGIDWTLLWETEYAAYRDHFYGLVGNYVPDFTPPGGRTRSTGARSSTSSTPAKNPTGSARWGCRTSAMPVASS